MSARPIRLVAVAVAVLAGAAIAALTTGTEDVSSPNLVAHSVELADDAGTARLTFTGTVEVAGAGAVTFGGTGAMAGDREQMTMTFTAPGRAGDFSIEMVSVGPVVYLRLPGAQEGLGVPTRWLSFDISKADADLATLLQGEGAAGSNDPQAALDFLRGAADDFEEVGAEMVGGVEATHYRGTVDLAGAAAELPSAEREAFERTMQQFEDQIGSTEMPLDVWIDAEGLPRRIRYAMDLPSGPDVPQGGTMDFTIEFDDFGADIAITVPPDDEVTDVTETFGKLLQLGRSAA